MNKEYTDNKGITFNPPEGMENATLQERLKDYELLTNEQMLQKYGIKLTYEVWDYVNEIGNDKTDKKNPEYFHD